MDRVVEVETRVGVAAGRRIDGVMTGMLIDVGEDGVPLVMFAGNPKGGPARASSTVVLGREDIGVEVALLFEGGDPARPMIIGRMVRPDAVTIGPVEVEADGERRNLELTAERQITLKCGKASITLTADGKVLIRGAYISSRSSGAQRIKGGSVHLN